MGQPVHIQHLAGHHAVPAAGGGQRMHRLAPLLRAQSRRVGDEPERLRQEGVPRQNGHGLAVDLMTGGPPPPEVVVVHAGQIVVNEGIGVDALQRRAQRKGLPGLPAQRFAEGQGQHGPDPLAPRQQAVAHGLL